MDYDIGPIDIGDLPGYNLPEPTISLVNYDAETGIVEFSDGSTYNTNTAEYTAGEQADANTQVSNQVYATRFGERAPQIVEYFDRWQNLLSGGMDIPKDVDKRDDAFNETIYFTDPNYQGFQDPSPITWAVQNLKSFEDIRTLADLPEYLSIYDEYQNSEDIITSETVSEAYWTLLSGAGPEAALSEYYGTDITLGDTTGANYTNISKYGDMGEEEFRQFQSIIKPILEMSVPYVMLTQGLEYADAVEYTYTHDPMAAAVYTAYGVDLYRQTGDGSTYIFDPILGQEMRTLEVKDPNLRDIMPTIAQTVLITAATAGLGNLLSTMYANAGLSAGSATATGTAVLPPPSSALETIVSTSGTSGATSTAVQAGSAASIAGNATAAALITAAQGGDLEAALQAAVFAGGGEFLANSDIVKSTLDSLNGYLGGALDGIDINLTLGDARPSAGTLAGSAASALGSLMEVLTGSGGSGGGSGALCFAPPCEPGTVFVGNAFAGIPADELTEEVLTSWTLSGSGASSGTATITAEQFWNEFKNQWYNYKPDENNVDDPNANLPDIEILSEDPEALGAWGTIAAGIYSILPGTATIYDEDGNPVETNVLRAYIESNFDKFANDLKAKFENYTSLESVEKRLTEAAETGNEAVLMGAILSTKATGSFVQWLNTTSVLTKEYDPDSEMGRLGQQLIDLADAKTPEQMQNVFDGMDARLATAITTNDPLKIVKALYGSFADAPKEFFYHYIASELAEEAVQAMLTGATNLVESGLGKVFGTVFGPGKFKLAGKALEAVDKGLEKVFGKDYITRAVDKGLSVLEAFAGGAQDTYDQAYKIVYAQKLIELKNRNPSLSDEELEAQAADMADTVAQEYALRAGIVFTAAAGVSEGIFGNEVFERIFGRGRAGEFSDILQVMGMEGISEFLEEGGTNIYQQVLLAELDPNKEFSSGEAWAAAFIGGLAGTTIAGTALVGADTASIITKTLTGANRTVADIIGRAKKTLADRGMAIASAQLAAEMDTILGDMQGAARDIVYFNVMNEVNDAGYTSTDELKDVFSKYDGSPTSEQFEDVLRTGYTEGQLNDVTDAFSSLEGFEPTYEDLLNILNGAYDGSNAQQAVLDYANPLHKSREEVLAAAEAAGITLTETQINDLIGRGDDADIGSAIKNLVPDTNNPDATLIAHIDYDNGVVYYKDGTTYNLRTGEFGEGTVDADGNVKYGDGTTYNPDDNTITGSDGTQVDPTLTNTDNNTDDQETTWFDDASDADKGVANTLWTLFQNALNSGDQNTANGFLDIYRNLTGVDTQPPDYEPPDDGGGDTGQNPDSGQDSTGGVDLTNLLNQLIQNGATTEQVDNLRTEIIGLMGNVASQESVDKVQETVDEILTSLTDVAKQSTLVAFRDQLFGMIDGLASQSSVDSLAARVAANEAAGMTRDEATQKAIKDLSTQLGVGIDELAAAINENRDAIGDIGVSIDELNGAVTAIQGQLANLASQESVDALSALVTQYEANGLSRDEALQQAMADLSEQLGVSVGDLSLAISQNQDALTQLGVDVGELSNAVNNINNQLKDVASQTSVNEIRALMEQYQAQNMSQFEALQQAIADISTQTGKTPESILAEIAANRDAINALGVDIGTLNEAVIGIQNQLKDVATRDQVENLSNLVAEYEAAGLSRDEALQQAIQDLSDQTGQSVAEIQAALAANQETLDEFGLNLNELNTAVTNIQEQLKNVATRDQVENLSNLVAEYEAAGLSRDEALQQAIQDLSDQTGQSVAEIQAALAENQDTLDEFGLNLNELNTAVTNIQEQLQNVATRDQVENLSNLVAEYEAAGLSRDAALQQAIKDLSEQTGQSVEEIQAALAENQDTLDEFGLNLNELNTAVGSIQEQLKDVASQSSVDQLLDLINEYEAAGQNRDTATQNAISDLSTQLGTTEQNLIDEILGSEQRITGEIDQIAELIGKPPSAVTDADIDFVSDIIAQQEALGELFEYTQQQLAYDVTGDGVIDSTDLDILQRALQGENVDLSQASQFQPSGLYAYNQQLAEQTQGTVIDQATQTRDLVTSEAERTRLEGIAGDLLGILEPTDITGRKVTVDTPDPARIGYLYDFSSIFATPQQEGLFVSPYGGQRGYAKGGTVLDVNDELLKLLER